MLCREAEHGRKSEGEELETLCVTGLRKLKGIGESEEWMGLLIMTEGFLEGGG